MAGIDAASGTGPFRPRWQTAVWVAALVLAVVVVRNVFVGAHQVLGWAAASSIVAVAIAPLVTRFDAAMPRPVAIAAAILLLALVAGGAAWVYNVGVLDEVGRLQEAAPAIAADIEARDDRLGTLARDIGLERQVAELVERLDERTGTGGDVVRSLALSAPPFFISMILTIFLILFGRRIVTGAVEQLPPKYGRPLGRALPRAVRRAQVAYAGAIAQAVVNGAAVHVAARMLDVPAAGLLALLAGLVAMVPYVGISLGWLPVLGLALGVAPMAQVLVAALVAVAIQVLEAVWWRPLVDGRGVYVGPAVVVVVAVLGHAVYGLGAALTASAFAVVALALVDELTGEDEPIPTPLDEPDHSSVGAGDAAG